MKKTTITAHAGCLGTKKDSIESILAAIEIGANISEVDVNCLESGIAILKHDEVNELDENAVPLENVFELIKYEDLLINLDIKNKKALGYIEGKAEEIGVIDKIFLSGVDEKITLELKNNKYKIKYLMNVEIEAIVNTKELIYKYINFALETKAIGLNIDYKYCTQELINEAHKNNLIVSVWTVDNANDIRKMLDLGVDNITTNRPDLLISTMN